MIVIVDLNATKSHKYISVQYSSTQLHKKEELIEVDKVTARLCKHWQNDDRRNAARSENTDAFNTIN
jgi:hypothetical protein